MTGSKASGYLYTSSIRDPITNRYAHSLDSRRFATALVLVSVPGQCPAGLAHRLFLFPPPKFALAPVLETGRQGAGLP